mgnify:CR=1 FL=1|tara:strand:- start:145473 stop:146864 length:1392 start_codon:yes stop_codon:yes gene_type:complete
MLKRTLRGAIHGWSAIALTWLISAPMASFAAQPIDSVRLHRAPDHTRIVFDLGAPLEHKLNKLANPDRIVIDLIDADLKFDVSKLDFASSPITNIRVGKHDGNRTRVVFDLKETVRPRTNLLKPIEPFGWRLVLDLFDNQQKSVKSVEPAPHSGSVSPGARPMVVAIDAGHGGEDPGARGPSGVYEKNVVLAISKKLYELMKKEPGIKPVLVRDSDYYVPLAERRKIASERHSADVFISIHADAFTDRNAHGASVFALSNRGATSAQARYLAKIANDSDRIAGVYEEEKDSNGLLSVLAEMTMSGSMTHSLILGRQVIEEMGGVTKLHGNRRKVEQAGFAVLKEPSMVSILVETGFISNRDEEKNLNSYRHQEKLARAILNGVNKYFETHPQPGSWYAARRNGSANGEAVAGGPSGGSHRIQSGDTLSSIARRYSVTEVDLRRSNGLSTDMIQVGQVLRIPGS